MQIEEEIKRLQHKASIMEFVKSLIDSEDFLVKRINNKNSTSEDEVRKEVVSFLKSSLTDYLNELTYGKSEDEDNEELSDLTSEEISALRNIIHDFKNGNLKNIPIANQSIVQPVSTPILKQPIPQQTPNSVLKNQPPVNTKGKALISDTSYITDQYGPLEGIYSDMPINILKDNGETFTANLPSRPEVQFEVPKECVVV